MRKVLMIVLVFMLFSTGCANSFTSTDKLKIVTSIFPIGDILENLGGDEVEVKVLVSPGASPHNYDPKPSDIAAITEADVVFVVGGEFDNWMKKIMTDAGVSDSRIVELKNLVTLRPVGGQPLVTEGSEENDAEGIEKTENLPLTVTDDNFDPHFWLSPQRVGEMIDGVTAKFKEMDPDNAALYDWENDDFRTELNALNDYIKTEVGEFKLKKMVTFHDSFGYFADDYGLEVVATIEPQAGVEPTPEQLQGVNDLIKANNLPVIFIEPQLSSDLVESLVNDLQVQIGELDPVGGIDGRVTYQSLIRHNVIEMATYMK